MTTRRGLLISLGATALATPFVSLAQQQGKIWRIGYLGDGSAAARAADSFEPFRDALAEFGYVVGRNIVIETRWTNDSAERRIALAAELVRLRVDVIVTHGVQAAQVTKAATSSIPIVVAVASDMLRSGLVASLARPGGNLTGLTDQVLELAGKEVELLREMLPKIRRLAVLWESTNPGGVLQADDLQAAARKLGLHIEPITLQNADDIERAFNIAARQRVDAVILAHTPLIVRNRVQLARVALEQRIPLMSAPSQFPEAGALMSYGPDLTTYFRRAAYFVDRILKGAKPGDLPVEQPTKFELVINLKTAKTLGIKVPQSLLLQATRVIE